MCVVEGGEKEGRPHCGINNISLEEEQDQNSMREGGMTTSTNNITS